VSEIQEKERRIRELLDSSNLDGILLSLQSNFAWATGGKRNYVGIATEMGVASLLITRNEKYVITSTIEKYRIIDEELTEQNYELIEFDWYDDSKKVEIIKDFGNVGSDDGFEGTKNIADQIAELRYSLTPEEIERYQWLGKKSGEAIADACFRIKPGDSEYQIAADLSAILIQQSIIPVVLLVASDERVYNYRHPIPTDKKIKEYVMVVLCARKYGLITSVTRMVHFGTLPGELRRKHDAVVKIDAAFIANSKPGANVGEIFLTVQNMYAETGYPDEWKLHHQGGPTGYAPRDYRAVPQSPQNLVKNQAIAWNPSITGTKSEDTIIIKEDETPIITESPNWPMLSVKYAGTFWNRADILCK